MKAVPRSAWLIGRVGARLLLTAILLVIQLGPVPGAVPQATAATPPNWWSTQWDYRVSVTVAANNHLRTDKPAEITLNFTTFFNALGQNLTFDPTSLRLLEVVNGAVVDANVPFQFDPATNYNATTNASGTLIWLLKGNTAANSSRTYDLYFDRQGKGFTAVTFPDQVQVTTANDAGQSSFRIQTANATYFYQKEAGGFSTLLDLNGNDWLGYQPTPANSPSSTYRGIPNMVHPEGKLHPGATGHTTTLVHSGPLKETLRTTINTDSDSRQWDVTWEFFPSYSRMTVLDVDHSYWFLYEGTPGGDLEPNSDFVVRSNGAQTPASQSWAGDLAGEEWLYFADPGVNRALYLVNHAEDTEPDSYRPMGDSVGDMTVFGFGRQNTQKYLSQVGAVFTIGLMETTTFGPAATTIRGAYKPLAIAVGNPEAQNGGGGSTTITIVKDAQPNNKRNFVFTGDLGKFRLDDPKSDDADGYNSSKTFTVTPGVYRVQENAATGWSLAQLHCTPTHTAIVHLPNRQVEIAIANDETVTCTFVNQKLATLRVQQMAGEAGVPLTLYGADDVALIGTQTTNQWGKSSFVGLPPGTYRLCVATEHCMAVTTSPGEIQQLGIGDEAQVTGAAIVMRSDFDETDVDEVDESLPLTDDVWLNQPMYSHQLYLPFISTAQR